MRKITAAVLFFFLAVSFLQGCGKTVQKKPTGDTNPVEVEKTEPAPATGWSDADTYTVRATGADLEKAREGARHRILKDIVNVRVLNGSRYTDITKIQGEFDKPLKSGRVIQKNKTAAGYEIYFQIRDRGLKKKFERK